jgi:hypothetical protein
MSMLKKITLATALVLSMASAAAVAQPGDRGQNSGDHDVTAACQRAAAPNICHQ